MAEEKKDCGCGCGHDHEHEHEHEEFNEDLVVLEDEEGNEIAFHYITTIEHEGKEYVYLQPTEESEEDFLEIYEIETVEEDGEAFDNLLPVEDELYEVLYGLLMQQIENGEGCDCEDGCDCEGEDCDCCK